MKKQFMTLLFLVAVGASANAVESASRNPNEDWQKALARQSLRFSLRNSRFDGVRSATNTAIPYSDHFDVRALPEWNGTDAELLQAFLKLRDERLYSTPQQDRFPRRTPWLFPNDGCWARAVHSARSFERSGRPRPGKIFAFGNLALKTPYAPEGYAYWSYHVVAAYRIANQAVVFDAAIEPLRPLTLDEWISRFSASKQVTVAVCDTYAYGPTDTCQGGSPQAESSVEYDQQFILNQEWDRMVELHYNPQKVLGDEPPWKKALSPFVPLGYTRPIRSWE